MVLCQTANVMGKMNYIDYRLVGNQHPGVYPIESVSDLGQMVEIE